MGLKYLWDTNIVIYYLQNQLSKSGEEFIDNTALNFQPTISVITEIELLCWSAANQTDITLINNFLDNSIIYGLDNNIKLKTIEVRKIFKLKLPDAIIAASAIINDHTLISRNLIDFKKVASLSVIDPFTGNG